MNGLKALRDKKLLTQKELAGISGVGIATISRLEGSRVRPSIKSIRALAKALNIQPQRLRNILINGRRRVL